MAWGTVMVVVLVVTLSPYENRRQQRHGRKTGQADAENVETRIWRPSWPVIHLATAVHGYLHLVGPAAEVLGFVPLMTSRPVIEYLIRNAEYCETVVAKSSRLRIDADRLIKIRLAQAG